MGQERRSMDDKLNVAFPCAKSEYDNCVCDCCHGTGRVLKIQLPTTLYYDGKSLTTKYRHFWICDECREKLITALTKEE